MLMGITDLTCRESISLLNGNPCRENENDQLYFGGPFQTFLFFDLPPPAFFSGLKKAELILFKIPAETAAAPCASCHYARPLLDFFNVFYNCYTPPRTDDNLCAVYRDRPRDGYAEIDVTGIVNAWLNSRPENKGLLIESDPDARGIVFASMRYNIRGMRPFLRLTYEGITRPLSAAPASVEIK